MTHDTEKARGLIGLERKACRSCGAAIIWAKTINGKAIPLDAEPVAGGNVSLHGGVCRIVGEDIGTHVSHFATCPHSKRWRAQRGAE